MPSRVLAYEPLWSSEKIGRCAAWAQAEYAWLYGLADAHGSFELTSLPVILGKVAPLRKNLSLERLDQIFSEFQDHGLLFVWEEGGKRYGHWTNSQREGRTPPPSAQKKYTPLAPPVPLDQLAAYMKKHGIPGKLIPALHGYRQEVARTSPGPDTDTESETDTAIPAPASPAGNVSGFDDFWKAYPQKEGKSASMKAWKKILPDEHPKIFADIARRKKSAQWLREGGQFIPHAATYLNQRRWEDAPDAQNPDSNPQEPPELEAEPWHNKK